MVPKKTLSSIQKKINLHKHHEKYLSTRCVLWMNIEVVLMGSVGSKTLEDSNFNTNLFYSNAADRKYFTLTLRNDVLSLSYTVQKVIFFNMFKLKKLQISHDTIICQKMKALFNTKMRLSFFCKIDDVMSYRRQTIWVVSSESALHQQQISSKHTIGAVYAL